jgi:hypothetical protein
MSTFFIPGDAIASVSVGGTAPETGFFSARIESVEAHPSRTHSRKIKVAFDNGFSIHDWLTTPYDAQGKLLAQYNDNGELSKRGRGCLAQIKKVFLSAGYENAQMAAQGVTDDWLIGKTVHLEWHSAKDLGAQYGEIAGYITPKQFESNKANDKVPAIAASTEASNVVTTAPSNGVTAAPAPSAGMKLPPPPSAQNIVN